MLKPYLSGVGWQGKSHWKPYGSHIGGTTESCVVHKNKDFTKERLKYYLRFTVQFHLIFIKVQSCHCLRKKQETLQENHGITNPFFEALHEDRKNRGSVGCLRKFSERNLRIHGTTAATFHQDRLGTRRPLQAFKMAAVSNHVQITNYFLSS